jgi:hypothetical protein
MRLRVLLAAQVLVAAMAGPAFADWQAVGVVDVTAARGRDRVEANFDKPARQLRFTAEAGDVSCRSIKLEYRSGKKQKVVQLRLKAGAGDVVDVAGEGRILKRVELDCATGKGAAARVGVAVLFAGDQAGAAAAPGVVAVPNVVIQNSQANDNKAPGGPAVATQPSTNVVIQDSQVNERPPGEPGVVTVPQRNVVLEDSRVNQGQGSAPGVVMTPPASTNVVIAPAQSGAAADANCPPAQTAIGAMRQAGGAIQPATQAGTTAPACQ